MSPKDQFFFIHIPRTMGTALKDQCLWPNYRPDETILNLTWHDSLTLEPERYRGVKMICGHLGPNIKSAIGHDMPKMTMLRDPIYRSRSMYYFCKRTIWHYLHNEARLMSLEEFAKSPVSSPIISNAQARHIVADIDYHDLVGSIDGEATRNAMDSLFFSVGLDWDKHDTLAMAQARLDEFFFVGVADRFYYSACLLWHLLGIENPVLGPDMGRQMHPYLKSNIYPLRTREYNALMAINEVDMALYEYANQKLTHMIETHKPKFV